MGIFCAHQGARVTLTDQLEVVPILRHNVEQNPTLGGGSMEAGSKLVAKHGVKIRSPG